MQIDLQQKVQHFLNVQSLDMGEVSRFTPADFRTGIQFLVTQDDMPMAQALADAGLSLHPHSEDVLAIAGLLAAARQDWPLAVELLRDLCEVQKDKVQPMTYHMLARALFCQLDLAESRKVLQEGLRAWPQDPSLLNELDAMALEADLASVSGQTN